MGMESGVCWLLRDGRTGLGLFIGDGAVLEPGLGLAV